MNRITEHDRSIIRKLIEKKAEYAADTHNAQRVKLWTKVNDLEKCRPVVWVNEEPWTELAQKHVGELTAQCDDSFLRSFEVGLKRELFRWRNYRADMVIENILLVPRSIDYGKLGMVTKERVIGNVNSDVESHEFERIINTLNDVELMEIPAVSEDAAESSRRFDIIREISRDLMPVELQGVSHQWFILWDMLIRWFGVEQAMLDLVMNPELIHAALDKLQKGWLTRLDQFEDKKLLSSNVTNQRVGSGGYAYTKSLPLRTDKPVTSKDQWGCGNAQIFTSVSPEMHDEFSLKYEMEWLKRFGLVYYGCCERLDIKMHLLKEIPNLRKVSCSVWADKEVMADACRGKYVVSLKPNPASLAEDTWRPEEVRKEIGTDMKKLEGCNIEIILKDISTCRGDVSRISRWVDIASELAGKNQ